MQTLNIQIQRGKKTHFFMTLKTHFFFLSFLIIKLFLQLFTRLYRSLLQISVACIVTDAFRSDFH